MIIALLITLLFSPADAPEECVILLHGLARSSNSMDEMAYRLERAGFAPVQVDYASTRDSVSVLADDAVERGLERCEERRARPVHFVTHSMGGILVRSYLARHDLPDLGRVVMLAPPNGGSEIVDLLGEWTLYGLIFGPAGRQLGTTGSALPPALPPPDYPVGILTGDRSLDPLGSFLLPGEDDGRVSVESARLEGISDFQVVPHTHSFIMMHDEVIDRVIRFLQSGSFEPSRSSQTP